MIYLKPGKPFDFTCRYLMRIYRNCFEMIREVERDLWEMGIRVQSYSMQDQLVATDPDYETTELQAYPFRVTGPDYGTREMIEYMFPDLVEQNKVIDYIQEEKLDRLSPLPLNPGNSYRYRLDVWEQFLHDGKFSYTYSARMVPQLERIVEELRQHPSTRQAIINIHSNFVGDLKNLGGKARIPCSMYYQFLLREDQLDLIYTMRSCDFLTHFSIDVSLGILLLQEIAWELNVKAGHFTMFIGSLHAYQKDMKKRKIF